LNDGQNTGQAWQVTTKVIKGFLVISHFLNLLSLFSDVAIDSVKTVRNKPLKSTIYGSIGAFIYSCCKLNPDHQHFINTIQQTENEVALVPVESQNPKSVDYLKMLNRRKNDETLRITSIGLFSIMWIDDFPSNLATYDATCEYLQPEMKNFHERIIDIGWWNNWWNLQNMMKDYDVNY
jgi:Translocase of the Inner Mitochondrial membrane 29